LIGSFSYKGARVPCGRSRSIRASHWRARKAAGEYRALKLCGPLAPCGIFPQARGHCGPRRGQVMASIIPRAIGIYRSAGCETISGFSSYHFFNSPEGALHDLPQGQEDGRLLGVSASRNNVRRNFRDYIAPQRILVIGNAFGWSTIALSLIFPDAKTLAIDIDAAGVQFTNELIDRHGL
jgi:hypothetical protein